MDTPVRGAQDAPPPDIAALLTEAISHPDPWFAALAAYQLTPRAPEPDVDLELVTRLEAQVATGQYTPLAVATEDVDAPGPHGPVHLRVYRPDADVP